MAGRKLGDPIEERLAPEWSAGEQVIGDASMVGSAANVRIGEQRLDLGCANELPGVRVIVERLDTHPIACAEQHVATPVPQHEAEHPVELFHAALTHLLVEMQDDFAVRL
jgi:hypothetical protein